jgi:cell division control protein 6
MGSILRTIIPFQEDYVPPNIVDRNVERLELKKFLEPIVHGTPQLYNLHVTGNVGVGKTLLTKFIIRELPAMSYYIKLTEADDTFNKVLYKIVNNLGVPISPYSLPSNIVLYQMLNWLNNRKIAVLLVLDDFDKAPIRAVRCLLHEIPRGTNYCNLLIISRIPTALEELPPDTKSTLRIRPLTLKPYDADTLYQILKQRVELALNPNAISDEILARIAEEASTSGSAREAIEILKIACLEAEQNGLDKVTWDNFQAALEEMERKSLEETICDLPINHKLILLSCRQYPRTYEEVYREWMSRLKAAGLKELSIYRFRDLVADLKKLDLIRPEIKGQGRGKGFSYYLKLSPHVDPKIFEKLGWKR